MAKAYGGELEKERKQLILEAAEACVTEEGIDGATMKKVAARAKISTGMIAYYFRDKNELMIETLSTGASRFRHRLTDEAGAEPGIKRLRNIFELTFGPGKVNRWPFFLEFAAQATRNEDLRAQHIERATTVHSDMERCSEQAVEEGTMAEDVDATVAADLLLALYHGLGVLTTVDGDLVSRDRAMKVIDLAIDMLSRSKDS